MGWTPYLGATEGKSHITTAILTSLQNHVFVHEALYLRFRRKHVRHFNVVHAIQHKGTNFGEKNHSAAMQPTMGVNRSSSILSLQSDIKAAELEQMYYFDYAHPDKK